MVAALIGAAITVHFVIPPSCLSGASARLRAGAGLEAAVALGCRGSATFRDLIRQIDTSDGLVYVNWAAHSVLPRKVEAALLPRITDTRSGTRYLWIVIRRGLEGRYLASVIGHELQHAMEVLVDPSIRTAAAAESRFAREQRGHGAQVFDTEAALRAGHAIFRELRGR